MAAIHKFTLSMYHSKPISHTSVKNNFTVWQVNCMT